MQLARTYHFARKYKLLHILFWICWYWNLTAQLGAHRNAGTPESAVYLLSLFSILCSILLVYTAIYKLLPAFFDRGCYFLFLFSLIAALFAFSFASVYIMKAAALFIYQVPFSWKFSVSLSTKLYDNIELVAAFTAAKIIAKRVETELNQRRLEKEKIEAELNFLKAQINPHFLFNTINSIYVLMNENIAEARNALLKFSEILRYQLYESNAPMVLLSSEIALIENYIELEKLRKGDSVQVNFNNAAVQNDMMIAPFLLINFVENAFKHISASHESANFVTIHLENENGIFLFSCSNSFDRHAERSENGIGINNAKRRLELIYPGKHHLEIKKEGNTYTADLQIQTT